MSLALACGGRSSRLSAYINMCRNSVLVYCCLCDETSASLFKSVALRCFGEGQPRLSCNCSPAATAKINIVGVLEGNLVCTLDPYCTYPRDEAHVPDLILSSSAHPPYNKKQRAKQQNPVDVPETHLKLSNTLPPTKGKHNGTAGGPEFLKTRMYVPSHDGAIFLVQVRARCRR